MKKIYVLILLFLGQQAMASLARIHALDHSGERIDIDTAKNKTTVLIFISAQCPCSDSHIEEIKRLKKKYSNVKFYGVHSNYTESKSVAIEYFKSKKINFPIIHDSESSLAKKLGALKTPHAYILQAQGNIVYRGGVTNRSNALNATKFYLDSALLDIKENRMPRTPMRKTLGCYIALKD
ncbi:redoxin domain-containing protein [Halobacteriovorax sp. HLS]|uniref:redoxin domain-containing protein n=1 Tax=Halobacteriovorax sp. HLS TaxID=2234000 RepID=UPI000FD7F157|nr:redoxin domain-containing protein [Halobacteriovorax sp. HLS]